MWMSVISESECKLLSTEEETSPTAASTYYNATQPQDMVPFDLKGVTVASDWPQYELIVWLSFRFTSPTKCSKSLTKVKVDWQVGRKKIKNYNSCNHLSTTYLKHLMIFK